MSIEQLFKLYSTELNTRLGLRNATLGIELKVYQYIFFNFAATFTLFPRLYKPFKN